MSEVTTDEALSARALIHEMNMTIKLVISAIGRAQQFTTELVYRNANRHLKCLAEFVDKLKTQCENMEEGPEKERLE